MKTAIAAVLCLFVSLASGGATGVSEWVLDMTLYGPVPQLPSDHKAMIAVVEFER